jgi:hypothetical protein
MNWLIEPTVSAEDPGTICLLVFCCSDSSFGFCTQVCPQDSGCVCVGSPTGSNGCGFGWVQ